MARFGIPNRYDWIMRDREKKLLSGRLGLSELEKRDILMNDPMWSAAMQGKDVSASNERAGHFQSAEGGGNLLPSTGAGAG